MRIALIALIILISSSVIAQDGNIELSADSALIRIRLDADHSKIYINGQNYEFDSFGNRLTQNSWFIVHLPVGEYNLLISTAPFSQIDSVITLRSDQTVSLDYKFIYRPTSAVVIYESRPAGIEVVELRLLSDPDSCDIFFNGIKQTFITPKTIYMNPGMYRFQMRKQGFEELTFDIDLKGFNKVTANFMPLIEQPEPLTAEQLGLVYLTKQPILDIKQANRIKDTYSSLAESFMIFPLSQGLLAKLVVDDDQQKEANIMVGTGIVLTAGSYILSKVLFKRKRDQITAENEIRKQDNIQAKETNKNNDRTLQDENNLLIQTWMEENLSRGNVELIKE